MLGRIFPKQFDNAYRGHWLAIWLLGFYALIKALQGTMSMINTRMVAAGADGIPLDMFNEAGVAAVMTLFALLGMHLIVLPLQTLVALIRYRAMIPFLYLMFLLLSLAQRVVVNLHPMPRAAAMGPPTGFYINLALLAVLLTGFALSLMDRRKTA